MASQGRMPLYIIRRNLNQTSGVWICTTLSPEIIENIFKWMRSIKFEIMTGRPLAMWILTDGMNWKF
jgi:hypothetical protein